MVKNEADIIEDFVRHNLNYLDELHVIVQTSDDGTHEILSLLQDEGLNLVIVEDRDRVFRQGEKLTAYGKQLLKRDDVAIVLALDADEFIKAPSRTALRTVLLSIPPDCFGLFEWKSYVPTAPVENDQPLLRAITHRVTTEAPAPKKVILTKLFLNEDYEIPLGSHSVRSISEPESTRRYAHIRNMALAHFPIRTTKQLQRKVRNGLERLATSNPAVCAHWRTIDSLMQKGTDNFLLLQQMAADYQFQTSLLSRNAKPELIHDPLPCDYSKKYHMYVDIKTPQMQ